MPSGVPKLLMNLTRRATISFHIESFMTALRVPWSVPTAPVPESKIKVTHYPALTLPRCSSFFRMTPTRHERSWGLAGSDLRERFITLNLVTPAPESTGTSGARSVENIEIHYCCSVAGAASGHGRAHLSN
jgi:hypothetical protein